MKTGRLAPTSVVLSPFEPDHLEILDRTQDVSGSNPPVTLRFSCRPHEISLMVFPFAFP
jgi:hypothetical protein